MRRMLSLSAGKSQDRFPLFATSIGGRSENIRTSNKAVPRTRRWRKRQRRMELEIRTPVVKKRMDYEEDSRRNLTGGFDCEICQFILIVNTGESSQSFC